MPVMTLPRKLVQLSSGADAALVPLARKLDAVSQLIEGRLTLLEAASRFQAVGGSDADGETVCRTVIGWVHLLLNERPEQAEAVSERLESELQCCVERAGGVRLPLCS
jgi:hypothetical protein